MNDEVEKMIELRDKLEKVILLLLKMRLVNDPDKYNAYLSMAEHMELRVPERLIAYSIDYFIRRKNGYYEEVSDNDIEIIEFVDVLFGLHTIDKCPSNLFDYLKQKIEIEYEGLFANYYNTVVLSNMARIVIKEMGYELPNDLLEYFLIFDNNNEYNYEQK